jgi:rsbT co-antagonist protein RsbR
MEERLERLEDTLAAAAGGVFDMDLEPDMEDADALTGLEAGVQMLIADLGQEYTRSQERAEELEEKLELIHAQKRAILELSTPILEVWDEVLTVPVIGVVDTRRSAELMEKLLATISDKQAHFVILDITGVEVVDTKTADHFVKVIRAAELLGTKCVVTGIRPAVSQTLVDIGVDLESITTLRTLRDGLRRCLRWKQRETRQNRWIARYKRPK